MTQAQLTNTGLTRRKRCVVCKELFHGYGNNAWPIVYKKLCCDECNEQVVLPARLEVMKDISQRLSDLVKKP